MRTEIELVGGVADGMVLSLSRILPQIWRVPLRLPIIPLQKEITPRRRPERRIAVYERTSEMRNGRIVYIYEREEA